MQRRKRKFNFHLISLAWVLGIQFLLLPFYHFHPEHQHSHATGLPSHQHNAFFHSIELDSIAHLANAHNHNSEGNHSHHPEDNEEDNLKVEPNKVTLKSKNPLKVLEISSTFSPLNIQHKFKTYHLPIKLNKFTSQVFQDQIRERSPPPLLT